MRVQMVSIADGAGQLGVSADTLRRFIHKHHLPFLKLGRRFLLNQLTIEEISRKGARPAATVDRGGAGG